MHIVRAIKKYNCKQVEKALFRLNYLWRKRRYVPRNVEAMVIGLPRWELEWVLYYLKQSEDK